MPSWNPNFYNSVPNWSEPQGPANIQFDPENFGLINGGLYMQPSQYPVQESDSSNPFDTNPENWPIVGNLISHAANLIGSDNGWYGIGVLMALSGGAIYLLRGTGPLKKPVNIPFVKRKVKPVYIAATALGVILLGTYASHESFAFASKKKSTKKKSTSSTSTTKPSSTPAPLDSPHATIGPAATKSASKSSSSSSSSSSRSVKSKSSHSGTHLAPAALDSPNASVQPKFSTASKSHPYLTTHGFAHSPEPGRPLAGDSGSGSGTGTGTSTSHTGSGGSSGTHPLSHIVPGLGGSSTKTSNAIPHPSQTIHNVSQRQAQAQGQGTDTSGSDFKINPLHTHVHTQHSNPSHTKTTVNVPSPILPGSHLGAHRPPSTIARFDANRHPGITIHEVPTGTRQDELAGPFPSTTPGFGNREQPQGPGLPTHNPITVSGQQARNITRMKKEDLMMSGQMPMDSQMMHDMNNPFGPSGPGPMKQAGMNMPDNTQHPTNTGRPIHQKILPTSRHNELVKMQHANTLVQHQRGDAIPDNEIFNNLKDAGFTSGQANRALGRSVNAPDLSRGVTGPGTPGSGVNQQSGSEFGNPGCVDASGNFVNC